MPIRFRCGYCNKLLGIARRKAGSETTCPHCGYTLTVPDDPTNDTAEMEELDELLNPVSSPAPQTHSPAVERPKPVMQTRSKESGSNGHPHSSSGTSAPAAAINERPLFERNVEDVLGTHQPIDETRPAKTTKAPTSGMDALSLGEERSQIVISVQKATLLACLVVILIGVSFAAGYLLASAK
jgi:phage FluMu protein Com